jgi:formate-dependent phosphoribosylglycinamide formyltransferase (GAR transformylase)
MGGFVANIGASLEEFAVDVRAILELTINNK